VLRLRLLPSEAFLQPSFDEIIGEAGHGDLPGFGFVIEGANEETRQGRSVVLLGHGVLRVESLNRSLETDSIDYTRGWLELAKGDSVRQRGKSGTSCHPDDLPIVKTADADKHLPGLRRQRTIICRFRVQIRC
jgi:hypothetical protein